MQAYVSECAENRLELAELESDILALCEQCPPEETAAVTKRLQTLTEAFHDAEVLAASRLELCEHWECFLAVQQEAVTKLKSVQHQLDTQQDLSQDKLNALAGDLLEVQASLQEWQDRTPELQDLSEHARLIVRHRPSRRTLTFTTEMQFLLGQCEQSTSHLEGRQGQLDSLSSLWDDFQKRKQSLLDDIQSVQESSSQCAVHDSTLPGLHDYTDSLKYEQGKLEALSPDNEELRSLGRRLMAKDVARMHEAQEGFTAVELALEAVQSEVADRLQGAVALATQWQQYADCRASVTNALQYAQPVIRDEINCSQQTEAKDSLDKHKVHVLCMVL